MPKFRPLAEIEKEEAAKTATLSLIDNDRPYDAKEEEAEKKAERYSIYKYPKVPPIPGTLGNILRNVRGGNATVIEILKNIYNTNTGRNNAKFLKNFLILWNNMDDYSKNRVDIFDILCEKYDVPKRKFYGVYAEGMFDNNDILSTQALSEYKPVFVELLKRMASLPKNSADRKLLAEALGITKDTPLISITDNSKHETTNVQVNNNLPSFASSIKKSEKVLQDNLQLEKSEPIARLTEGKQEYIDAEWSEVKENENNLLINKVEKQLRESAKEL